MCICIAFIQRRPNVFAVGPTLYQCYTNVLCLLRYILPRTHAVGFHYETYGEISPPYEKMYTASLGTARWAHLNTRLGLDVVVTCDEMSPSRLPNDALFIYYSTLCK